MPRLVRLFLLSTAIGYLLASAFVAMIMVFDIAHLGHLILNVDGGWFAGAIFTILTANVFAAVQVGVSVMRDIDSDEPPAGSGGPGARQHVAIPVNVGRNRR